MNQKLEPSWDLSWLLCVCVCVCVCVGYLKGLGARQLPGQFLPASTPDRCRRWLSLMSSILTQVRLKAVLASVANTKTCLQRSGRSQKVRNSLVEARDWWGLEQVKEAIVPKWLKFLPPSSKLQIVYPSVQFSCSVMSSSILIFAGILSAALSQRHLAGFEIAQLESITSTSFVRSDAS